MYVMSINSINFSEPFTTGEWCYNKKLTDTTKLMAKLTVVHWNNIWTITVCSWLTSVKLHL